MQGEAVAYNDFKLHVNRNGYWEDLYFDFSYSPITDENKEIKGVLVICIETTTRVAALQGANESEYRFRTMAEESDILIALSDESSKAVYFSKAWTDLTGRSMEDLLAFGWVDLLHPEDRDRYMNIYLSAFEKQVSFTGDFRVLSKTGDYRWLLAKGPPRFRSDDSFAGYISSCVDITERKANEQYIQQLINRLPASVVVIRGPELIVEMINQANLDYWNKTAAEVVGKPFLEILPDLADQPFAGQLRQVMDTGEIIDVKESPVLFENPDGSIRETFVDYTYQPLTDINGKRTGVLVMSFEITERVTARRLLEKYAGEMHSLNEEMAASNEELATTNEELTTMQQRLEDINQELETSTSRLRMAIESTSLGTWEYNLTSSEFYCSKEFRTVYGFPHNHAVTYQAFIEHVHPDDLKGVEEAIQQATTPGKGGYYELTYRILRFDNHETRWVKAQGTVYFDQGLVSRFIGTVLDITEIKAAEEKSAKLAAIIASSDDAIISKTLDSVITSWNDAAERIFGYRADEMIGETIYKLIPVDRHEEEPLILARLRTGERVDHFETKRRTKDGRLIDVSVTISPVKDREGRIIGLSKIARDITEKKLDEVRKNDFIGMVSHELKTPLTSLNAIIQLVAMKLKQSEDGFLTGAMEKANHQVKRMTAMINGFLNPYRKATI
jgi:PAS domain S-box-containing protein